MKTRILVVDDNTDIQDMLKSMMEHQGWEVCQAANGKEALEIAQNQTPDLIVSDILMPVMDGYALCRLCKADPKLKDIPFVFYTATYTDPHEKDFALDLGADSFVDKPQKPSTLIKILKDLLEKRNQLNRSREKCLERKWSSSGGTTKFFSASSRRKCQTWRRQIWSSAKLKSSIV